MALTLNIRHLEEHPVHFEGELDVAALDLEALDELIRPAGPLRYVFDAERYERGILLQGSLVLPTACECSRCLKAFASEVRIEGWACLLPWEGEDAVVVQNDCVDLTPYLREDIVLALPQRPLCRPECAGLPGKPDASSSSPGAAESPADPAETWRELDKLSF